MYLLLIFIHAFTVALLTGFMAVVQWSLVPAQNELSAEAYTTFEQGMNRVMTKLTPALMITAVVSGVIVLAIALYHRDSASYYLLLSVIAVIAMIISTLMINAPINSAIESWDAASPPANWLEIRDRWEFGHMIRSYIGLVGLATCLIALIVT